VSISSHKPQMHIALSVPTETIVFQATKPNLKGNLPADLVTCDLDDTETFPDGVIHVFGTITGVFTPKS
jgi:hypothetical protein